MINCPVCHRETSPIKIGEQSYCSECGTAAGPKPSMDITVRPAATAAATPAPAAAPHPSASALHARVKPSRVLDLRRPQPAAIHSSKLAHAVPAAPPQATLHERHLAHLNNRLEQARRVERSAHIQKFNGPHRAVEALPPAPATAPAPPPVAVLPPHAVTQHEAMAKLAAPAVHPAPAAHPVSHHPAPQHPGSHRSRTVATVAAVALMGGYIWLSNYPKFALQNASNQAGLAATLPGYLPSSYSLRSTDTSPGLVTLNFTSPSSAEQLRIAQHRTSWDSNSLLDNFVAKASSDYSTVQSQGLTIYLFNNNQASWVNHGIWYSIEGASRLSREQILKIAYSL